MEGIEGMRILGASRLGKDMLWRIAFPYLELYI